MSDQQIQQTATVMAAGVMNLRPEDIVSDLSHEIDRMSGTLATNYRGSQVFSARLEIIEQVARGEVGTGSQIEELDDAALAEFLDEGVYSRPQEVVWGLVLKAHGDPQWVNVPLRDLVTPKSLLSWNLQEVARSLPGFGMASRTRYLSPTFAKVPFIDTGGEAIVIEEVTPVHAFAFYVQYLEEINDWRIHSLDRPDIPLDELRS